MKRLINNRMYPSVNGGMRRMWDSKEILRLTDGKVEPADGFIKAEDNVTGGKTIILSFFNVKYGDADKGYICFYASNVGINYYVSGDHKAIYSINGSMADNAPIDISKATKIADLDNECYSCAASLIIGNVYNNIITWRKA